MGHARLVLAASLALCIGGVAHAACDTGLAERMNEKLHPQRALDHERAVCEPWRGFPGRYVVVLPLPRPGSEGGSTRFDLDVLVVQQADNGNTEHARVASRLYEENALAEDDALRIAEIRLDMARYTLAPEVHAFGLRILRQESSIEKAYSDESLSLYAPQGARLVKLLDRLQTTRERGQPDGNCAGEFEALRGSVSVARVSSNGLAELLLRQSRSESRSAQQGEECVMQESPTTYSTRLLRYDGKEYRKAKGAAPD